MPNPDALPNPIDFLTGEWAGWRGATMPDGPREPWPKFSLDGAVRPFPGVTIVCHVPRDSASFQALVAIQDGLRSQPFARHLAYLPPTSLHMTLFDLSNETRRGTPAWPEEIDPAATWPDVSDALAARLEGLKLPAFEPTAAQLFGGSSLIIEGQGSVMEQTLRAARDELRAKSRIYRDDHDSYVFHVTLAYPLRFVSKAEAEQIDLSCRSLFETHQEALTPLSLGPAEMCDFKDMHAFVPRMTF